jgi:hypothetical protein
MLISIVHVLNVVTQTWQRLMSHHPRPTQMMSVQLCRCCSRLILHELFDPLCEFLIPVLCLADLDGLFSIRKGLLTPTLLLENLAHDTFR